MKYTWVKQSNNSISLDQLVREDIEIMKEEIKKKKLQK